MSHIGCSVFYTEPNIFFAFIGFDLVIVLSHELAS